MRSIESLQCSSLMRIDQDYFFFTVLNSFPINNIFHNTLYGIAYIAYWILIVLFKPFLGLCQYFICVWSISNSRAILCYSEENKKGQEEIIVFFVEFISDKLVGQNSKFQKKHIDTTLREGIKKINKLRKGSIKKVWNFPHFWTGPRPPRLHSK